MTQSSLWQQDKSNLNYTELCNALYEREIESFANDKISSLVQLQSRLKSLSYYVRRTAYLLTQVNAPIFLDVQNASWSCKQLSKLPIQHQSDEHITHWFKSTTVQLGLVIPVFVNNEKVQQIKLDSIDRVDSVNNRVRSNYYGWFDYVSGESKDFDNVRILRPTKKVMIAACCGHQWNTVNKISPIPLTLRELLLTCSVNWKNLKKVTDVYR